MTSSKSTVDWYGEMTDTPKVTVYIPTYNYGAYLQKSVESVLKQNYEDWELIIINDGSTDSTQAVLAQFSEHSKIRIYHQQNQGLTRTNNKAIEMSRGEYIMRLDADDYLDENALLVLANVLDCKPEVALVYPDYYVVSEDGELVRLERRSKAYEEDELLDLPSHAACAMIRKSCLIELGGYNEDISCQDGYDLWIRLIQKYQVYNVNLPLFYYRRHAGSMSSRMDSLLRTRQQIKREFVAKLGRELPRVLAIIPTRDDSTTTQPPLALRQLAGSTVLDYTVDAALKSGVLDRIVVTSESQQVLEYAQRFDGVEVIPRSSELGKSNFPIEPTVVYILSELERREGYVPDAVMLLFVVSPLREARHIQKALDTLQIFNCDSVVSVREDNSHFYRRGRYGLEPIIKERKLRIEREIFYADNAAVVLSWTSAISPKSFVGSRVSHVLMTPEESFQIDTDFEFWVVEQILKRGLAEQEERTL
jgi:CMP-N-acetylneuraminic acid synthetase